MQSENPNRKGLQTLSKKVKQTSAFWIALALALMMGPGCATYSDKMKLAQEQVVAGNYKLAVDELNTFMGVNENELPTKFNSNTALALLDRATIEQAQSDFKNSARDFGVADEELQLLDISNDTVGQIGKYLISDSSTKYKASPVEKLALNGFNMMNYLAMGQLTGASVEARRFTVMRDYLTNFDPGHPHAAFGSYLAGFTFAQQKDYGRAMRYYDEALEAGALESLREPVSRLAKLTSYRGKNVTKFLSEKSTPPTPSDHTSSLLVVVGVGRVPYKVPERMPIGAAIGVAGSYITGNPAVLGYSAFKVVIYPELVQPPSIYNSVRIQVDDQPTPIDLATNLGVEIKNEYEAIKPKIVGAAISRLIVRAAAAEAAREAGNQQSPALGWALALATEAGMVSMDKPDTRSWMFLPSRVYVYQTQLKPGTHTVAVQLGKSKEDLVRQTVDIKSNGFAAIVITAPR
ncbi:MAG: hypothetical protein CL917_15495 [Deltaproteobacteria bacterium]|nr:hypothetical protein [Deltaproteobacteria bacterium]